MENIFNPSMFDNVNAWKTKDYWKCDKCKKAFKCDKPKEIAENGKYVCFLNPRCK